jgi:hypothetical protein
LVFKPIKKVPIISGLLVYLTTNFFVTFDLFSETTSTKYIPLAKVETGIVV